MKRMNKKIFILGIVIASILAFIGIGFAAWGIINNLNRSSEGEFTGYTIIDLEDTADTSIDAFQYKTNGFVGSNQYSTSFSVTFDLKEKSEAYNVILELIDEDSFLSNVTSTYTYGGNTVNGNKAIIINNIDTNKEITITYTITTQSSDWSETGPIYIALEAGKNMYLKATANSNNGTWSIVKKIDLVTSLVNIQYISKPLPHQDTFVYNGESQYCFESSEAYTLINNSRTDAGSQTVTVRLNDNWQWNDYTTADYEYTFYITPQTVSIPTNDNRIFTYNGNEHIYYIEANDKYTVSGNAQTNADTYNVVVSLINSNYMWSDSSQSNKIYEFIINPKQISITSNLTLNQCINVNYSAVTNWSSFKSSFNSITFSENGFTFFNVYGMSDGSFCYVDSGKTSLITNKMFNLGHIGLKTTYDYVAGSTYRAYIELTSTNYELTGQDYVWLKYKTAKIGSTYYTIEDAIAASGTDKITMVGNVTTDESKVQITAFSKLLSTKTYTNSSKVLTVPHTSGGTGDSYANKKSSGGYSADKKNVCACLYIPSGITYNTSKNINVLALVYGEGAVQDHGVIINDGVINMTSGSLQSWGFTKGEGIIYFNSGTIGLEIMKFNDYPGSASNTSTCSDYCFPITAWVLNNISCKSKYYKGAQLKCIATAYGSLVGYQHADVTIIGSAYNSSGCLFAPSQSNSASSDYIEKKGKLNDCNSEFTSNNQVYTMVDVNINGGYSDKALSVSIAGMFTISTSQSKPLPISYMDINVQTGSFIISSCSYLFLKGTHLTVYENAELIVNGNSRVIFDKSASTLCTFFDKYAIPSVQTDSAKLIINGALSGTGYISGMVDSYSEGSSLELYDSTQPSVNNYIIASGTVSYKTGSKTGTTNANDLYAQYKEYDSDTELTSTNYTNIEIGSYNSINGNNNIIGWISNSDYIEYRINYLYNDSVLDYYVKSSTKTSVLISVDELINPIQNNDSFIGFELDGWYVDSTLETPFVSVLLDSNNRNYNVYLKVVETNYIIRFGYSDGEGIEGFHSYDDEFSIAVNQSNPNMSTSTFSISISNSINLQTFYFEYNEVNYIVVGWVWLDLSDIDNPQYIRITEISSSNILDIIEMTSNNELLLYGYYSPYVAYTIEYDLDGGLLTSNNPDTYYITTDTFTLNNPTKEGYTFVGWSGTGLTGIQNMTVTVTKGSTGNRSYVAHYSPITYNVSYNLNGGSASGNPNNYTPEQTYTLVNPTREGYTFTGWSGTGLSGDDNMTVVISRGTIGDLSYVAHWQANQYTINYNGNGATSGLNYQATVTYDSDKIAAITASGHAFSNGNKPFIEWNTQSNGTGTKYYPGDDVPATNLTLYAIWGYTVTYDANDGIVDPTSISVSPVDSVTLPTPSRTGYTFNGWYTASSGGTKIGNAGATYKPNGDIIIYAQWTINSYKVTISTSSSTTTVTVGGTTISSGGSVEYNSVVKVVLSYSESDDRTFTIKQGNTNVTRYSDEVCTNTTTSTSEGTYYFRMPAGDVTISSSSTSCLLPNTLVLMSDGSYKEVQYIVSGDELLVFNHETGRIETSFVTFNDYEEESLFTVINLHFTNNHSIGVIYEHGFFDLDLMTYVYITEGNYLDYIGHRFYGIDGEYILDDAYISEETVKVYSPITCNTFNYFTEGLLSMPGGIEGLFNYFDYDDSLKYDEDDYNWCIENIGLFTFEDLEFFGVSRETFDAYNAKYFKIAMAKGLLTEEMVYYYVNRYGHYFDETD